MQKSNTHSNNGSGEQIPNQDNEKQKRKKEKPQPMSLQQFNQLSKQSEPGRYHFTLGVTFCSSYSFIICLVFIKFSILSTHFIAIKWS